MENGFRETGGVPDRYSVPWPFACKEVWVRISQSFLQQFPSDEWFLDKLKTQKRFNPAYHPTQILDVARFYDHSDVRDAFCACRTYNVFTSVFVKGFLENHHKTTTEITRLPEPPLGKPFVPSIKFLGPPGVGKTHLAIGIKACQARKRVRFCTAEQLTHELSASEIAGTLQKILVSLTNIDLLIIDELGYLELSKKTATLFFQLISKRYERGSVIIASNKPFEEWGQIFQDDVVAAAILDRLLHHSHTFFIQGKSYRMKQIFKT